MKHTRGWILMIPALVLTLVSGCKKHNGNVWDDNATSGNYKGNGRALWGNDELSQEESFFEPSNDDFIALQDEDLQTQFVDGAIPQPKTSPGDIGSKLPGIDGFHRPIGSESAIFKNVHFNTDDHILRGQDYLGTIDRIASYMNAHPDVYIFVTGNCDERGPEAYNLSLGARRANYIRTLLVQKGIDAERIHTISYGKERPTSLEHNQEAWKQNRRAEFMIYQKR